MVRDPQFGATVMFGVGGVLAEAVGDVVFRPAPLDAVTAEEMIDSLASQALLGEVRGEAAVSRAGSSICWSGWDGSPPSAPTSPASTSTR